VDFVDFDFNGARTDAVGQYPDGWHIAYGFVSPERTFVFFHDTDSFADSAPADRCTLQESESALDWTGGDGWSRLGHRDQP
jgi:hypothetical protein